MDATIMPSTSLTLDTLKEDYPHIIFRQGDAFRWSPEERIIYYAGTANTALLLHEIAHAELDHAEYTYDIELLQMERDAWDHTRSILSKKYGIKVNQEEAESMLDTYRDWLHDRSLCPTCGATGIQADTSSYRCLACSGMWRVNEARVCALRRYKIK